MNLFLLLAAGTIALVLALLLWPLLRRREAPPRTTHRQLNAAIYRDHVARLEQDLQQGVLAAADHAQAVAELQRRVAEDTRGDDAAPVAGAPMRTLWGIALALPLAAGALYAVLGNPSAMSAQLAGHTGSDFDVERMVAALAEKQERDPGNLQGWAMLARSYKVLGRMAEAERAFERAGTALDGDAAMLANYADVAAANAGGRLAGKPAALVARALQADPSHPMALWLSGTVSLEAGEHRQAIATWQRLATLLPPDSEDARMLQGAIEDARRRAGPGDPVLAQAAKPAAGAVAGRVSGTVSLDAALRDRVGAGDTLMVIARRPGERMPLAVLKVPADRLPMAFTLDDSLAMSPEARISAATDVEVEARVSKSGQARPQPGDLASAVRTVKVGAQGLQLNVAQVR